MQKRLAEGGAAVPGVDYTTVMSKYDELVVPYTSGYLEGEKNYVLQDLCPLNLSEHLAMAFDPVAAQITFNALDPAHARPIDLLTRGPFQGRVLAGREGDGLGHGRHGVHGRTRCRCRSSGP